MVHPKSILIPSRPQGVQSHIHLGTPGLGGWGGIEPFGKTFRDFLVAECKIHIKEGKAQGSLK